VHLNETGRHPPDKDFQPIAASEPLHRNDRFCLAHRMTISACKVRFGSVAGIAVEMLNGVYSASKSYVISLGHSLQKDLGDKGVRVQTVLPSATATRF
jgi:NAD(P)-dependent dehydrogenase (short-subunit alcohol dehydrogenase family)